MRKAERRVLLISMMVGFATLAACGDNGGSGVPKGQLPSSPRADKSAAAPAPHDTTTMSGATLAQFTGDAARGEAVFATCRTCHTTEPRQNRMGPSLAGIVGAPAGRVEGYNYSPANANSGITWSEEKLFQYLENPHRVMPGTKMVFAGIPDPQRRADLIAWLRTQS